MNNLTLEDLNTDKHLSVAIAVTFAIAASHIHNDRVLNGFLIKSLQWTHHSYKELRAIYYLAWKDVFDDIDIAKANVTYASNSARYAASVPHFAYGNRVAKYDVYAGEYASYATAKAVKAVGKVNFEHDSLKLLLPLILKYKIKKQKRPFGSPEKVFDLLEDKDKQQFLFNLDILRD